MYRPTVSNNEPIPIQEHMPALEANGSSQAPYILLVEDDEAHANLTKLALEDFGVKNPLIHVMTGEEALDLLLREAEANQSIGCVLLDVYLPQMSGIDLLRTLRECDEPYLQSLPVMLLTASYNTDNQREAERLVADAYVHKPLDLAKIKRVVTEAKLLSKAMHLAESAREYSNFAYAVAHDLKGPIRSIRSFGQLLHSKTTDRLDQKESMYINRILTTAERMEGMISALFELAEIEGHTSEPEHVALSTVMEEVLTELDERIQATRARVVVDNLPTLHLPRHYIYIVFFNLIENAIKYRQEDKTPHIMIRAGSRRNQSLLGESLTEYYIAFEDNGIGFAPSESKRIFLPFARSPSATDRPGHGIGLATVKKIIHRLGGDIEADAQLGTGATFTIRLPTHEAVAD